MAELVCDKVNKTDDASVALCKKFINRRYHLIYDSHLWKDSLELVSASNHPKTIVDFTNTPTGVISDSDIVTFPSNVERVLAMVGGDGTNLSVEEQSLFFQRDTTLVGRVGTCSAFHQIKPHGFPYLRGNTKPGITNPLSVTSFFFRSTSALDVNVNVYFTRADGGNKKTYQLTGTVNRLAFFGADMADYFVSKDVTEGDVTFDYGGVASSILMTPRQRTLRYERVRLLEDPGTDATFLSLCKMRAVGLFDNSDAPGIQNIDDALIAHAQADMLERARQYSKANDKRNEAMAQVKKAVDLENNQSAKRVVITPQVFDGIKNGDDF